MAENIDFKLKVSEDQLGKTLEKDTRLAKSLGSTLEIAVGAFAAGAALKGLSLLSDGFRSLTGFLGDSVDAAAESETAQNRLQIAMAQTGILTKEATKSFNDFASQLQETTAFEDDAIISSAALIQSLSRLDSEGLQRATTAAANLAATFDTDLESASRIIGKAAEGNTVALQKLGIEFTKGATDAETFSRVLEAVESRFGGAAQAQAKTFGGVVAQLSNIWGDLKENIGAVVVQNPAVIAAFRTISSLIVGVSSSISSSFGGGGDSLAGAFRLILDGTNALILSIDAVVRLFNILSNVVIGSFETIKAAILAPTTAILNLLALIPGIGDKFKDAAQKSSADFNQLANNVQQRTDDIRKSFSGETFLSGVSGQIAEVRNNFDVFYNEVKNKSDELKNNPIKLLNVEDEDQVKRTEEARLALLEVEQSFYLARNQIALENDLADQERFAVKTSSEIEALNEFELTKSELQYQAAVSRAKLLATQEERSLANQKALYERDIRDDKIRQKTKAEIRAQDIANQRDTFATIATLSSSNNRTLATIGKAAAITQIAIDGPIAITKALAAFPPPFNFAAASLVGAAVAAQAARVAGVSFANGGFMNATGGATAGPDNTMANLRDGEMVLNGDDQKTLFDAIKSGSLNGGGDIIIQVDGREIARAVRNQVKAGFNLGVA